jgi:serpin B
VERQAAARGRPGRTPLVLLAIVAVMAGACGSDTSSSPSAVQSAGASPSVVATVELPSPTASSSLAPSGSPPVSAAPSAATPSVLAGFVRGDAAITVSAGLRVRSRPRVADDSLKFEPLLPLGTNLAVLGGPVAASGFTWYDVAPVGVQLAGGIGHGWVAIAASDGTPWVGIAPTPGLQLATATSVGRVPASAAAARTQAAAINAFGLDLYRRMLRSSSLGLAGKGVVISPMSIAEALAMADAGATGATATDLETLLRVKGWDRLSSGMGALDRLLASRDAAWTDFGAVSHELSLRMADLAFAQQGLSIQPTFLERIARTFGSGVGLVDYARDPEAARQAINDWVSRQTLGRIPNVLAPGNVDTLTRVVLVNAIYMKANWAREFDATNTVTGTFTRLDGSKVSTPTMHLVGQQDVVLAHGTGWQATELRYLGADGTTPLAMTLIRPDNLPAFESSITTASLAKVQAAIGAERARLAMVTVGSSMPGDCGTYPYAVSLSLPKFAVDTHANLLPVLKAMGLTVATDINQANFSGVTTQDQLYISAVIHQANLDVDERGTTAAAATVVEDATGGCTGPDPATTVTLRFDRPFLFLVRDVGTGTILFMGRVTDPTAR